MSFRLMFFLWLFLGLKFATAQTVQPLPSGVPITLAEAFAAAKEQTEVLRIQDALVDQAQERLRQAKGGIIPHLSLNWSYLKQDTPSSFADSAGFAGFTRSQQSSTRITATQPLFQGFREFSAFRMLRFNIEAQQYAKEFARVSLYSDVARAYYNVLATEKDLANVESLIEISKKRIASLILFTKLGRSPKTDLLSTQSQLANLQAEASFAIGARDQARQNFALATGLSADSPLVDSGEPLPTGLNTLETYLVHVEERPDIKGFRSQEQSADANVRVAKGAYWPTIDFTGNYYLTRTGSLEGSKWDLGVTFQFPIYEGGVLVSQVREASSVLTQSQLNLEQARRTAREEIASAYKASVSGIDQMRLLTEAVDLAEKTYRQQNRDYSFGANTNLDVLQALNSLATTRRLHDSTYYQTQVALVSLLVAQGKTP